MLLRRLDERLAMSKPEVWISKIHFLVLFFLIVFVLEIFAGFVMPITVDSRIILMIGGGALIPVLIIWFRSQIRFFDKTLSFKETVRYFLCTASGILLLGLLLITMPLILSYRVNQLLKKSDYEKDMLTISAVFFLAEGSPPLVFDGITESMEADMPVGKKRRYTKETIADTSAVAADTTVTVDSTSAAAIIDTSKKAVGNVDTVFNNPYAVDPSWFKSPEKLLIDELSKSPGYNYDTLKKLARQKIRKYDLSEKYFNALPRPDDDSLLFENYDVTKYREILSDQLGAIKFNKWVLSDHSSEPLIRPILILVFLFILPVLSFTLVIDKNSWRALIIALIMALGVPVLVVIVTFTFSLWGDEIEKFNARPYVHFLIAILLIGFFVLWLKRSKFYKSGLFIFSLQLLNYMVAAFPILLIYMFESIFNYHYGSFVKYLVLPAFLLILLINIFFIGQYRKYIQQPAG